MDDLKEQLMDVLENQARQQLMNQILFHILEQSEDQKVVVPLQVAQQGGLMGGIMVEVNTKDETITLTAVSPEMVETMAESENEPQH